jgi:hypothetical protein
MKAGIILALCALVSAVAVSSAGAHDRQPVAVKTSAARPTPTPKQQLVLYLAKMRPLATNLRSTMLGEASDGVRVFSTDSENRYGTWASAAVVLRNAANDLVSISDRARLVRPSGAIALIHPSFRTGGLRLVPAFRATADEMAAVPVDEANPFSAMRMLNTLKVANQNAKDNLTQWRDEITIICRRLLVPVPLWLKQVGEF